MLLLIRLLIQNGNIKFMLARTDSKLLNIYYTFVCVMENLILNFVCFTLNQGAFFLISFPERAAKQFEYSGRNENKGTKVETAATF